MSNFVEKLMSNRKTADEEVEETLTSALAASLSLESTNKLFKDLAACRMDELARVALVSNYFNWTPVKPEDLKKYAKNPETSSTLRQKGNEHFKQKKWEDALRAYNLAIMFAESGSEDFAFAVANRSAVLLHLGDADGALKDIDLAIASKYPKSLTPKLEQRRIECKKILKIRENFDQLDVVKEEIEFRKSLREEMLKIEDPNPLMPAASKLVKLQADEVNGRHLVLSEDVNVGTVLIVEKPYVFALEDELNWDTGHCHYCLKRIRRGVPCSGCVFAIYCNESCKTKAKQGFHGWECKCMASLHCFSVPVYVLLAFRIICKLGPDGIRRLNVEKRNLMSKKSENFGAPQGTVYESDSYVAIYNLQTHAEHLKPMDLYRNTNQALMCVSILENHTKFFEEIGSEPLNELKNFAAARLLHHIESAAINFTAVGELSGLDGLRLSDFDFYQEPQGLPESDELANKIDNADLTEVASAIYPVFSLLNHSCDANVYRFNDISNGTVIIMANRALKKGETLYISYRKNYLADPIEERQAYLLDRYFFKCQCIACTNNWPSLAELIASEVPKFCCPSCASKLSCDQKSSKEFAKCLITAKTKFKCGLCKNKYFLNELEKTLQTNLNEFTMCHQLVQLNRPREALLKLKQLLSYFQNHLFPPNKELCFNQIVLMKALALILYYSDGF